jgi:uncharacterized membrane protein
MTRYTGQRRISTPKQTWLALLVTTLLGCTPAGPSAAKDDGSDASAQKGAAKGGACAFSNDCAAGLKCVDKVCRSSDFDAGSTQTDPTDISEVDLSNYFNNWAKGYTLQLDFHGGDADGKRVLLQRDLFEIPSAFSFGSTHYTQGEVGFAVADTVQIDVDGQQEQIEVLFNFGLVVGSAVNPVHVDKKGPYPFACKPPALRIFFKGFAYKSTCPDLKGSFDLDQFGTETEETISGTVQGRMQAYFKKSAYPDDCKAEHSKNTCKKPDWYVDIKGYFGFELPKKDGR